MRATTTIAGVRAAVDEARREGRRVALVPTMGALHQGHLSLVARAREEADLVVVSVFVNPLQFGPGEDFERYPRDPEGDAAAAGSAGADLVFAPDVRELYPREPRVSVVPLGLGDRWEGEVRPGHFAGVLTVVLKLLNIVRPDVAVFGQKDFQQAMIVRAMVEDLDVAVRIVVERTVREADGLALSSRNRYLSGADRAQAPRLHQALAAARAAFDGGERSASQLVGVARRVLDAPPAITTDYLAVVDPATLEPREHAQDGDTALLAARLGSTRLIDNVLLGER
ncbi:MAG TPA: pantoate--beta-alanine ligase [Gemmatimonadales bacterium]